MTANIYAICFDFTCSRQSGDPGGLGDISVVIAAAVGDASAPRCPNHSADVKTIQRALNRFRPLDGGPEKALVVDGASGPLTRKAIHRFQDKWGIEAHRIPIQDGVVDVQGPTIDRLRKGAGVPGTPPEQLQRHLARLTEVLTAARAALQLARFAYGMSPGSLGLSLGHSAIEKFERHFHASQTPDPVSHLDKVDRIFLNMQTAVGHVPRGVILAADEPADFVQGHFFFCFSGGYYYRLPTDKKYGLHMGTIYMCPKSRTMNDEAFVYGLVHELAHYTGPQDPVGIEDIAYFHRTPGTYRALGPEDALRNADSYSQFAFDAIGKRDFNAEHNLV